MRPSNLIAALRFLIAATVLAWAGSASAAATAPTMTLSISPTRITLGDTATLTWSSTNANSCAFSGALTGTVKSQSNSSNPLTVKPSAAGTNTYTLTCTGSGGSVDKSVNLKITLPPPPTVNLSITPTSVVLGNTATLSWTTTNATSCAFSGAISGTVKLQSDSSSPLKAHPTSVGTFTYTLTCTGAGGSTPKSVNLTVTTPPTPTEKFSISPSTIVLGSSATLTWSSTNATSCNITGAYTGSVALQSDPSNPLTVAPTATGAYNYTLICASLGGSALQVITLDVVPVPPPQVTFTVSPTTLTLGKSATLIWSSAYATSCSMSGAYTGSVGLQSSSTKPLKVAPSTKGSYTYTLACTGTAGTTSQSTTLQVVSSTAPVVSLAVTPSSVPVGTSATLTWTSVNATSCAMSGDYTGKVGLQSSSSSPLTVDPATSGIYTYTLSCSGSSGGAQQSVTLSVLSPLDVQIQAAQQTANNTDPTSSCGVINQNQSGSDDGFYWEIGNVDGIIADAAMKLSASGSVQPTGTSGTTYTRSSELLIDSASKWMYASYVAEIKAVKSGTSWAMPKRYVPFLNFTSGYDLMSDNCTYITTPTVTNCLDNLNGLTPSVPNGTLNSAGVGLFDYGSGHMEVLEAGADPSLTGYMTGGNNNVTALANELTTTFAKKNVNVNLSFVVPILAGGIQTTPADYATFLQGMLSATDPLVMISFLNPTADDRYAVCTNPFDPTCVDANGNPLSLSSPTPPNISWHYGLGHWIEDDPDTGDGAYSSPGRSGFYPWIDSTKTYYGMVARYDISNPTSPADSPYYLSAVCGEAIRAAFKTGVAQH